MLAGGAELAVSALGGGHSIYKLQGRNQDLSMATTGNARKQIVSTLKEMEDGKVWHEYYHKSEPGNKWWFDERSRITTVTELNTALISKYQKVKVRFGYIQDIHPTSFSTRASMYIHALRLVRSPSDRLLYAGQGRCTRVQSRDAAASRRCTGGGGGRGALCRQDGSAGWRIRRAADSRRSYQRCSAGTAACGRCGWGRWWQQWW